MNSQPVRVCLHAPSITVLDTPTTTSQQASAGARFNTVLQLSPFETLCISVDGLRRRPARSLSTHPSSLFSPEVASTPCTLQPNLSMIC
jgi:hypothetical protein